MKRLVTALVLAGVISMLPNPEPADAQRDGKTTKCMIESVDSCDEDFEGNDVYMAAARGYCYMIRSAMCRLFDAEDPRT